jgi:hypothetical protein
MIAIEMCIAVSTELFKTGEGEERFTKNHIVLIMDS